MVKKKNMTKKNEDNALGVVDLEEGSDLVKSSWDISKDNLKRLKLEAYKEGRTMGGFLRDIVSDRFKANDRAKKDVSSKLEDIIGRCEGFFGGFDVDLFIDKMYDEGIDLVDLSNGEWVDVRSKIRSGSEEFAGELSGEDIVVKFDLISPTRKQRLDLLKIFRN